MKTTYYWVIVSKKDEEPYDEGEGYQFYPDKDSAETGLEDNFWDEIEAKDYKIIKVKMQKVGRENKEYCSSCHQRLLTDKKTEHNFSSDGKCSCGYDAKKHSEMY